MSETDLGQSGSSISGSSTAEGGFLHIEEKSDFAVPEAPVTATPFKDVKPVTPLPSKVMERSSTTEHLAARNAFATLDPETPEIKERLNTLRIEVTRLVTGVRWNGRSYEETAEELIPLLNLGPVPQWREILIPFLFEIDRAGNLLPGWLKIIERGDPRDLPPDANPAETQIGRARRIAILMLGNYKQGTIVSEQDKGLGFARSSTSSNNIVKAEEVVKRLGELASDPATSLYAAPALVKQGTALAIRALIEALKNAYGWAKVDVVENCLLLKQANFNDLLLASALDDAQGLESYIAIPLYRELPLEKYLHGNTNESPRLRQQAALIVAQVLYESTTPPTTAGAPLPPIFERPLAPLAHALFEGARSTPHWTNVQAIHRLGLLLGRYWAEISRGVLQDQRIVEPVYACLPMMNDVERWMSGPGRDVLLSTLSNGDDDAQLPALKILGELREPRATSALLGRIEQVQSVENRDQAHLVALYSDTLAQLGDQRATQPLLAMLQRAVPIQARSAQPKRTENLPAGDAAIPGSIVYASVVKTLGRLGDRSTRDTVLTAYQDFDPYVRTQALEALKTLDPHGEDQRSRQVAREALRDARENIARLACQLLAQYQDYDAVPALRQLIQDRPALAATAYETLRQLGQ